MKARKIKRLRKRIGRLQRYSIRESASLFGDFYGYNRLRLEMSDHSVSANSPIRAIQIYMKKYRKTHGKKNNNESIEYMETTENWAALMVTDEKGFRTFYL
jgi:hypothetical protein